MPVPVYVPESVDLSFLKPRLRPAAQWFLHSLYAQQVNKRRTRDRPVPLYSKILQKMMGRDYAKVISGLVAHKIVERGAYRNGKHSRLYRLTDRYAADTHRRVEVTGKVLCRKIAAHREGERAGWLPVHHHLHAWLRGTTLNISDKMYNKYARQKLAIDMIRNGDLRLEVDKYQRVHTNVTNLKRSLRKYLALDGAKLVELDICNSQPLMLAVLLLDYYNNSEEFLVATSPALKSISEEVKNLPPPLPPLCSALSEQHALPEDVNRYIGLCERGQIYHYLDQNLVHNSTTLTGLKRRVLSRILYCKNVDQDNDLSTQFAALFPHVSAFVRYLKRSDYRHLPQQLQRVEAGLVIHGVCTRLMHEHPHVPVLTVHDSVLTPQQHEPLVRKLLTEECLALGCGISIKAK